MKRIYIFLISLFIIIPFMVKAETLTYNVCESGCEYTSLRDVGNEINNMSDLSDKDIIINVNKDITSGYNFYIGDFDNMPNSVTINGNNHDFNDEGFDLYANSIEINDCNNLYRIGGYNSDKISINESKVEVLAYLSVDSNGKIVSDIIDLSDRLDIDETSLNNIKILGLTGNIKIDNMNLSNCVILNDASTLNIYNSKLNIIYNLPWAENVITNIYNSTFKTLRYKNITSDSDPALDEYERFFSTGDTSTLNYDIYDVNTINMGGSSKTTTTVYFDKEATVKVGNKLNLVNYLDYYTEDKEIEYTIEDESIAKIENKELIGLKEGSTKVTVTTDEGHVIYRINLTVEKETIPEKIDKMTIKVPITGSKIKAWVLIVGGILLGIVGICVYMLIKRKK